MAKATTCAAPCSGLGIDDSWLRAEPDWQTPTYTKPMQKDRSGAVRELNRIDFKNRRPVAAALEDWLIERLRAAAGAFDALILADQVQERNCGIVTDRLRAAVSDLARRHPQSDCDRRFALPHRRVPRCHYQAEPAEARAALDGEAEAGPDRVALRLAGQSGRPAYMTLGAEGLLLAAEGTIERCRPTESAAISISSAPATAPWPA